jgi:hypothetical protein
MSKTSKFGKKTQGILGVKFKKESFSQSLSFPISHFHTPRTHTVVTNEKTDSRANGSFVRLDVL